MKKTNNNTIVILCIFSFLFGIFSNYIANRTSNVPQNDKEIVNYSTYQDIFFAIVEEFDLSNLAVKAATTDYNIAFIDKDLSFDTRGSISASIDGEELPTEEQLTIEDTEGNIQYSISIIYTSYFLGNDYLNLQHNRGFESNLNPAISNKTAATIITYKNLIILLSANSNKEVNIEELHDVTREIIDIIKNYKE